ncbi:hypothetical cytosolic protein [Syntrophus aciditrophicus SB]|uniref:Hypothetical cytosolic protein n=1 Tax=Syntrophus aciditrophicus (strain SB) TaxID=56780 RepID=Q2LQ80_SYNAS|nr:hypothetical cytosolic protein [Syntrophus aciditrophicus SB]
MTSPLRVVASHRNSGMATTPSGHDWPAKTSALPWIQASRESAPSLKTTAINLTSLWNLSLVSIHYPSTF